MNDTIIIKGARQHNLKNIHLELPKNALIVFTGLSGSGKSSLAFDTIYAEGQRRYVESLSSYARQFLGIMDKPDVDSIEGLSPAISIDQKSTSHNPRSTVGTVTEIYDYLRLLFARIGHPHCPNCGREISKQSSQQIVSAVLSLCQAILAKPGTKLARIQILSPVVRDRKGEFSGLFENLASKGYRRVRVDTRVMDVDEDILLIKTNKHAIDVIIDTFSIDLPSIKFLLDKKDPTSSMIALKVRLSDAIEQALALSDGLVIASEIQDTGFSIPDKPKKYDDHMFSEKFSCPVCNISLPEIEPRSFSFNSPHGACPTCTGIGTIRTVNAEAVFQPELSISEGGILPFSKMFYYDTWFSRIFGVVAESAHIDIKKPLKLLTAKQKELLLMGSGDTVYSVSGTNRFGEETTIEETYAGILSILKKRYQEADSEFTRGEIEKYIRVEICTDCLGKRLRKESLTITIDKNTISTITDLSVEEAHTWITQRIQKNPEAYSSEERAIATPIIREIASRLGFLQSVGLTYITLSRSAQTLSGGEAQRIRLASQIGSGLSGVLYVLDEPSIGLHQRDNHKLIETLKKLRDLGNTVIVVEHDRDTMEASDFLVDFGPGAGKHGGSVIAAGQLPDVLKIKESLTAQFLNGKRSIHRSLKVLSDKDTKEELTIVGASQNNLKNITVSFPLGTLTCITGVSGSGKSSLIVETLYPALMKTTNSLYRNQPGTYERMEGIEHVDKAVLINQLPIGRTPRSNPATYTGVFTYIRDLFAQMPEAKLRGYKSGRFSFNVKGGRCEACEGEGQKKIEMQFLSDIYITCEVCGGKRYNSETLDVSYHGKSIAQVLDMTAEEAVGFFHNHPMILGKLQTIVDVGLGYIHLGQPATTISGGEAQRVKLATELARRATGRTVYILDEPTTGLHFADIDKLLAVLVRLTETGNTVIVIEHNLDVIRLSDWIIDLGPEGGDAGGQVIAVGSPQDIAKYPKSYTGAVLKSYFP